MEHFDPIIASDNIKKSFIDYITTSFRIGDAEYARKLRVELEKEGYVAKGPYLDISGSYQTGLSLKDLIKEGEASPLFTQLEPMPEKERELKLERPLYSHQETALRKANAGRNLVVTTGTGSGKTECFLIPVINALLREREAGTLDHAVRAIVIYPMNALANDQMKRMRSLLKNYPDITFGLYNGNTRHHESDAKSDYKRANGSDKAPLKNELISRERMQSEPPHILITNYSMLEYMMLRPKDDKVFSGAKLRYIILDEAHIYKGTTGMETAMLMRRLRARISTRDTVQYILTSATLGNEDANKEITQFAKTLCEVPFDTEDIIRSKSAMPPMREKEYFPPELFAELANASNNVREVLTRYNIIDYAPDGDDAEKLYELLLHSDAFAKLIANTRVPQSLQKLCQFMNGMTREQVKDLITVCSMAEKNHSSLIKARYHFFVRTLEGAYVTLNSPKQLFLQRKEKVTAEDGTEQRVFEIAVCQDCGRLALVGKMDMDGYLHQVSRKSDRDPKYCDYFLVTESEFQEIIEDSGEEMEEAVLDTYGENDYVVCACCGLLGNKSDLRFGAICECNSPEYIYLKKVERTPSGLTRCPACGFGSLRAFYLGNDASTAVLGTELFEQLPNEIIKESTVQTEIDESVSDVFSLFAAPQAPQQVKEHRTRQFLCFSDSRSEAAFFANYMEKSYQEFLRRRAILQVAEQLKEQGQTEITVPGFVLKLTRFFDEKKTFHIWKPDDKIDKDELHALSESNAWIAVLNEMFNARRGTSLASLGLLSFEYQPNQNFIAAIADRYRITVSESRALLNQLTMDAVYMGAINAGKALTLNDAEREYIFFSPYEKHLVLQKTSEMKATVQGWAGRKRDNTGSYYPNARMQRLIRALGMTPKEADEFLEAYWRGVFRPAGEEYILSAEDFSIRFLGDPQLQFYQCVKCGNTTSYNVKNCCASVRCDGTLKPVDPLALFKDNHYLRLYQSEQMESLQIKEHTAQLSKNHQTRYQQAFVNKDINALSCSTTFEMGVDVGSLETVYMRNIPPSPANYVQRAGRAGRSKQAAAYVLTYAKLSSHDMTFYQAPEMIISGSIQAPVFSLQNEKVVNRHIYAVAMSKFFALHEEIYDSDNQTVLLNEGGYEILKDYLQSHPDDLRSILMKSIPDDLHSSMGILDFSWTDKLIGEDGVLEIAVKEFREEVKTLEKELDRCDREKDRDGAARAERDLRAFRCGKDDNTPKKSLIDFLVRSNVLPKYGFPVDTVELQEGNSYSQNNRESLQLSRDLQMAIAEYAPGAEVVADGKLYTSRYIRKMPGKDNSAAWEKGYYCECPECHEPNFSKKSDTRLNGAFCISCHEKISRNKWRMTLEPRRGFWTEGKPKEVPLRKPERDYKTEDYYIGDMQRQCLMKQRFHVNGQSIELESTSNDSLAVVGLTDYYVCEYCGYASERMIPPNHKTVRGYPCRNTKSSYNRYRLSHTFKTFVAKIKFCTADAQDEKTMLSVLYALLEGLSRELGIERTDIKGCLHREMWSGCQRPIFSVILYDAVAGGAGHVRRLITEDAAVFQRVLDRAIQVVTLCTCEPSCYQCLRNYYNSQIHDYLDRRSAAVFLKQWVGDYVPHVEKAAEENMSASEKSSPANTVHPYRITLKNKGRHLKNMGASQMWEMILRDCEEDECEEEEVDVIRKLAQLHTGNGGNPVYQEYFSFFELSDEMYMATLIWKEQHVMFFLDELSENYEFAKQSGWHCFCTSDQPDLQKMLCILGGK